MEPMDQSNEMEQMDQPLEILTTRPPFLNEYCLLHIFEFLELDDSINFGDTCKFVRLVADRVFQKHSKFKLFFGQLEKGERYINFVLSHIGKHISSLDIQMYGVDLSRYLKIIDHHCSNLQCLKMDNYKVKTGKYVSTTRYKFKKLEMLTLYRFDSSSTKHFLQSFRHLKTLSIVGCLINEKDTISILHNNPNIETFYTNDLDCLKFLPLIRNVQNLWSGGDNIEILPNVWTLLTLNFLTKLMLNCMGKNINSVLKELAKKGIMKEMELEYIDVDDEFFDILASFEKIELLAIEYAKYVENKKLKASMVWPSKLQSLRLTYFELTLADFIQIIRQITNLQRMDMCMSNFVDSDEIYFKNTSKWLRETIPQILTAVDTSTGKQCREIKLGNILTDTEEVIENTSKYWLDTEHIKILRTCFWDDCDHLGIEIDFPASKDL